MSTFTDLVDKLAEGNEKSYADFDSFLDNKLYPLAEKADEIADIVGLDLEKIKDQFVGGVKKGYAQQKAGQDESYLHDAAVKAKADQEQAAKRDSTFDFGGYGTTTFRSPEPVADTPVTADSAAADISATNLTTLLRTLGTDESVSFIYTGENDLYPKHRVVYLTEVDTQQRKFTGRDARPDGEYRTFRFDRVSGTIFT